ncbi:MAG: CDP-glycerol glycerophosphotransferase family protein, partial [Candidatus Aenigmarchaeota archaeon]|nr:CDP-glycerol glycerophosphotransferase family protein [Candidatus Aenigmarchaeota archaeon]
PQRGREVLVKAHPTRENEGELRAVCSGFGEGFVVVKKYDPRRAFMASDLVLTPFSTVATEALYCGKPVISVQPGLVGEDFLITNKLGVNPVVYRKEDLKPALERAMNDPAYQEEMARMREGFVPEGRATERVTRLAYEMLNA